MTSIFNLQTSQNFNKYHLDKSKTQKTE